MVLIYCHPYYIISTIQNEIISPPILIFLKIEIENFLLLQNKGFKMSFLMDYIENVV